MGKKLKKGHNCWKNARKSAECGTNVSRLELNQKKLNKQHIAHIKLSINSKINLNR